MLLYYYVFVIGDFSLSKLYIDIICTYYIDLRMCYFYYYLFPDICIEYVYFDFVQEVALSLYIV